MDPVSEVLTTCERVMQDPRHVFLVDSEIDSLAESMANDADRALKLNGVSWDASGWHYCKDAEELGPQTCQYVFVLDALNFCFWPSENSLEYDIIAVALKLVLEKDPTAFDAQRLATLTSQQLAAWVPSHTLPEVEERTTRLNELGMALQRNFQGLAANMVAAAQGSAVALVSLVLQYIPGFRDTSVYRGCLVHFYKRAQILVGDIWAAYGKRTLPAASAGETSTNAKENPFAFFDMPRLTMFADYRVPQLLRHVGALRYDTALAKAVDGLEEVPFGSAQEVEIRAATVVAVERLRGALEKRGVALLSVEVDWLLWQVGEESKDRIQPHHRTRTIYY